MLAILGRFASDGLAAAYEFPLPQAGDCLCQMQAAAIQTRALDSDWIHDKCGGYFPLFIGLLGSLLGQDTEPLLPDVRAPARYLKLMELKQNHPVTRKLIDAQARFRHVCSILADDPAKIRRRITV